LLAWHCLAFTSFSCCFQRIWPMRSHESLRHFEAGNQITYPLEIKHGWTSLHWQMSCLSSPRILADFTASHVWFLEGSENRVAPSRGQSCIFDGFLPPCLMVKFPCLMVQPFLRQTLTNPGNPWYI
jgi:hypothetical protein